jgi:hypothetical protein
MNLKQALALTALAIAAGGALADDITFADDASFMSTKTRAEVRAEVLAAIADGTLATGGEIITMRTAARPPMSKLSRRDVLAQLAMAAPRAGTLMEAP